MILPSDGINLFLLISNIEFDLIRQALVRSKGNRSEAARILGIGRTTLVTKMQKLCLMEIDFNEVSDCRRDSEK